jgi:hypothetical protein
LAIVLGVKIFGLTNATGGIAPDSISIFCVKKLVYPGCIMAIKNHFKFLSRIDPLRELNHEAILDDSKIKEETW